MAIFETATKYILDILAKNDRANKFGKDFLDASVEWVESWFLKPGAGVTTTILKDDNMPETVKKPIVEAHLKVLEGDTAFMESLKKMLESYEKQPGVSINMIDDATIDVKGNFSQTHMGDGSNHSADEINTIKKSKITVGGDFVQGSHVTQGHTVVQNNYFEWAAKPGTNAPHPIAPQKAELKALIASGKTDKAIERLLDLSESTDSDTHNMALQLSGRLSQLDRKENMGTIGHSDAKIERNQISVAVIEAIDGLAE